MTSAQVYMHLLLWVWPTLNRFFSAQVHMQVCTLYGCFWHQCTYLKTHSPMRPCMHRLLIGVGGRSIITQVMWWAWIMPSVSTWLVPRRDQSNTQGVYFEPKAGGKVRIFGFIATKKQTNKKKLQRSNYFTCRSAVTTLATGVAIIGLKNTNTCFMCEPKPTYRLNSGQYSQLRTARRTRMHRGLFRIFNKIVFWPWPVSPLPPTCIDFSKYVTPGIHIWQILSTLIGEPPPPKRKIPPLGCMSFLGVSRKSLEKEDPL